LARVAADAGQRDVHDLAEPFHALLGLLLGRRADDRRGGTQDPERGGHVDVEHGVPLFVEAVVGDVSGARHRLRTRGSQGLHGVGADLRVEVVHDDARAVARQLDGDLSSDASSRA